MTYRRRHGSRVTFALWGFIAVGLLASGVGVVAALILMGVLGLFVGAVTAGWVLSRHRPAAGTAAAEKPDVLPRSLRSRA
jgi:hypothetical protein